MNTEQQNIWYRSKFAGLLFWWLNRLILQWLFIRMTVCDQRVIEDVPILTNISSVKKGTYSFEFTLTNFGYVEWLSIKLGILPLTGYGKRPFKYLFGPWFIRVTKKRFIAASFADEINS